MTAVLKYNLVVVHPETGMPVALLADKPVPDWATDLVRAEDYATEVKVSKPASKTAK